MRLFEIMSPADFWDDARHGPVPGLAAKIESLFAGKTFASEEQARQHVLRALQGEHASTLLPKDLANERALAAAAPVYHDGSAWRIGTKNVQPKLTWSEIKLRPESKRSIAISGDASAEEWECDWKIHFVPCRDVLPPRETDTYLRDPAEWKRIQAVAAAIVDNGWFTPIFIGDGEDEDERTNRWVIEGQHRIRAVFYILGLPNVPGHIIEIFD